MVQYSDTVGSLVNEEVRKLAGLRAGLPFVSW
jgi:hypothetical protein